VRLDQQSFAAYSLQCTHLSCSVPEPANAASIVPATRVRSTLQPEARSRARREGPFLELSSSSDRMRSMRPEWS
jgi:hypothetical protein